MEVCLIFQGDQGKESLPLKSKLTLISTEETENTKVSLFLLLKEDIIYVARIGSL